MMHSKNAVSNDEPRVYNRNLEQVGLRMPSRDGMRPTGFTVLQLGRDRHFKIIANVDDDVVRIFMLLSRPQSNTGWREAASTAYLVNFINC